MPEETLVLVAPTAESRQEWSMALQKSIIETLKHSEESVSSSGKMASFTPPITRKTSYTFHKIPDLKGGEYIGTWMQGKMHGHGQLTLSGGKVYRGQWRQNQKHGSGKLEIVQAQGKTKTVYEGNWKADKFEGYGKILAED